MKMNAKQLRGGQPLVISHQSSAKNEIYILLDNVLDTYNIGSAFRLADAVGAKKLILCGGSATPPDHRIKKASINTTELTDWQYFETAVEAIKNLKLKIKNCSLIITVDNGIVAGEAVEFAKKKGIDVIITDHHVPSKKLPGAYAIVHSTKLCGAGVAWLLSKEIAEVAQDPAKRDVRPPLRHLELVALATVADLVPLIGANRTLTKFGIEELRQTKRVGLLAIIKEGGIEKKLIDVYQIGHIIGPRLNAMGRLEYAMDSLRLLCTKDVNRAKFLAEKLGTTNKRRQEMTVEAFEHAKSKNKTQKTKLKSLIFIEHESYEQGIIGLVAGRLVEEFYRPSIVVSRGKIYSKASARSVRGVNIIEFIRNVSELLVDAGGHPMAAGFTVETKKLLLLKRRMEELAEELFDEDKFRKILYIDLELPFSYINEKLDAIIQKLAPFGMGNPQPAFLTKKVIVEDMRLVGEDGKHLKLRVFQLSTTNQFDAIGFNMGEMSKNIRIGDSIDLVYQIERNKWNGNSKLQLKIKDLIKTN